MTRLQWCRKHIDEVAEACNLSRSSVDEVKQAAKFCDENADFAELPTRPIIALIRVRDDSVRERAISHIETILNRKTPQGGKYKKTLTERQIKKIIDDADIEVRKELTEKIHTEREEATSNGSTIKEITEDETNHLSDIAPDSTPVATVAATAITQREIDIHFDVMKKLSYESDIPRHKKRIDMMIKNKMLTVVE